MLHALEEETGKHFHFEGSEGLPLDHFDVVLEGTARRGPRGAPCPFREGDEVLVTIVEPHMYNVDDAVAKIDGYIVSVTRRRAATWARSGSCASRRPGAPRRPRIARGATAPARAQDAGRHATGGRGRRWRRIEASAPWPQRRTAPFRCHGGGRFEASESR